MNRIRLHAGGIIRVGALLTLMGCSGHLPVAGAADAQAPVQAQVMQEATAIALGNMAWESVKVSEVQRDGNRLKWSAATVTGKWRCQAQADGKKPYCER